MIQLEIPMPRKPENVIYENIIDTMGGTPLVRINRLVPKDHATVLAKCEFFNPLSSVKDRIGVAMIEAAEKAGKIDRETVIVERRRLLKALGAQVILTPAAEGMRGSINKAEQILKEHKKSFMPMQFDNPANPEIHRKTTAEEIWVDTGGNVDILVSGVGTGGTITGVAEVIKKRKPSFKAIAVEPVTSAVIQQTLNHEPLKPGRHKIQGIGAGFVPGNLHTDIVDEVILITDDEAFEWARRLAKEEGIFGGISSGGNMAAAAKVAARPENKGKVIVTVMCSFGERYLSTPLFEEE